MFIDGRKLPEGTQLEADVCIVGAGAAGITLARQLAPAGLSICLLESGGFEYDDETQRLAEGGVTGRRYFDLDTARLRFFGGTTNHWTGWCRPLDPIDFQARPYLPLSGWAISHSDLDEHYTPASEICQLAKPTFDLPAYADDLPPLFLRPLGSEGAVARVWQKSPPTRFGEVYRSAIESCDTVRCVLNANVVEIELAGDGQAVDRLRAKTLTGNAFHVAAKVFVLAAGGIENARLMLQPTALRPQGVGNQDGQVGRYFMLHPVLDVGVVLASHSDSASLEAGSKQSSNELRAGLGLSPEEQEVRGLPNHVVHFVAGGRPPWMGSPGVEAFSRRVKAPFSDQPPLLDDLALIASDLDEVSEYAFEKSWRRISSLVGANSGAGEIFTAIMRMEHAPNPDSRVHLTGERDQLGMLRIAAHWSFAEDEKHGVRRTAERLGEILGSLSVGRFRLADWLADDDQPWPGWVEGDFHHMGTTRMSDSPSTGVVDADCRVHGVGNLFVAGSSVFATGGSANPTLTIVAMALRLADRIRRELPHSVTLKTDLSSGHGGKVAAQ